MSTYSKNSKINNPQSPNYVKSYHPLSSQQQSISIEIHDHYDSPQDYTQQPYESIKINNYTQTAKIKIDFIVDRNSASPSPSYSQGKQKYRQNILKQQQVGKWQKNKNKKNQEKRPYINIEDQNLYRSNGSRSYHDKYINSPPMRIRQTNVSSSTSNGVVIDSFSNRSNNKYPNNQMRNQSPLSSPFSNKNYSPNDIYYNSTNSGHIVDHKQLYPISAITHVRKQNLQNRVNSSQSHLPVPTNFDARNQSNPTNYSSISTSYNQKPFVMPFTFYNKQIHQNQNNSSRYQTIPRQSHNHSQNSQNYLHSQEDIPNSGTRISPSNLQVRQQISESFIDQQNIILGGNNGKQYFQSQTHFENHVPSKCEQWSQPIEGENKHNQFYQEVNNSHQEENRCNFVRNGHRSTSTISHIQQENKNQYIEPAYQQHDAQDSPQNANLGNVSNKNSSKQIGNTSKIIQTSHEYFNSRQDSRQYQQNNPYDTESQKQSQGKIEGIQQQSDSRNNQTLNKIVKNSRYLNNTQANINQKLTSSLEDSNFNSEQEQCQTDIKNNNQQQSQQQIQQQVKKSNLINPMYINNSYTEHQGQSRYKKLHGSFKSSILPISISSNIKSKSNLYVGYHQQQEVVQNKLNDYNDDESQQNANIQPQIKKTLSQDQQKQQNIRQQSISNKNLGHKSNQNNDSENQIHQYQQKQRQLKKQYKQQDNLNLNQNQVQRNYDNSNSNDYGVDDEGKNNNLSYFKSNKFSNNYQNQENKEVYYGNQQEQKDEQAINEYQAKSNSQVRKGSNSYSSRYKKSQNNRQNDHIEIELEDSYLNQNQQQDVKMNTYKSPKNQQRYSSPSHSPKGNYNHTQKQSKSHLLLTAAQTNYKLSSSINTSNQKKPTYKKQYHKQLQKYKKLFQNQNDSKQKPNRYKNAHQKCKYAYIDLLKSCGRSIKERQKSKQLSCQRQHHNHKEHCYHHSITQEQFFKLKDYSSFSIQGYAKKYNQKVNARYTRSKEKEEQQKSLRKKLFVNQQGQNMDQIGDKYQNKQLGQSAKRFTKTVRVNLKDKCAQDLFLKHKNQFLNKLKHKQKQPKNKQFSNFNTVLNSSLSKQKHPINYTSNNHLQKTDRYRTNNQRQLSPYLSQLTQRLATPRSTVYPCPHYKNFSARALKQRFFQIMESYESRQFLRMYYLSQQQLLYIFNHQILQKQTNEKYWPSIVQEWGERKMERIRSSIVQEKGVRKIKQQINDKRRMMGMDSIC